jgi:predicted PurR-regulated permease PerM
MTDQSADTPAPQRSLAASIAWGGSGIVAFTALLAITWYSAATLLLLFSGILFGVFLVALSNQLGRLVPLGQVTRLVLVCLFLTGLFSTVIYLGGSTIAQQAQALSTTLRSQLNNVKAFAESHGVDTSVLNFNAVTQSSEPETGNAQKSAMPNLPSASTIASGTSAIVSQTWKIVSALFDVFGNIFVIVLLGLLIAAQPQLYRNGLLAFAPRRYKGEAASLLDDTGETLRRWLLGQLMTMSALFIITWIGLAVIGIPGALVLGFIVGLLSFIPNVGAVIAGALIVLASLGSGFAAIAGAFGIYLLVQFLEGNVLTPLIQRQAIDIPPATLFGAQIFLGFLFGLWGLALALPMIAVIKVVLRHVYEAHGESIDDNSVPVTVT